MKSPRLRVYLFGSIEVYQNEQAIDLPGSIMARSLLAYLCLHRERTLSRAALAGTFWPEETENRARRALSQALWQIRRATPDLLTTNTHQIHISPTSPLWVDVTAFKALIQPEPYAHTITNERVDNLRQAIQLYRNDLLDGLYDEWIFIERESLREQYLRALEALIFAEKSLGHYTQALECGNQLAKADPLRESTYRELMRISLALGQPEAALRYFETCQQVLQVELGVEPEPETHDLAEEIARQNQTEKTPYLPPRMIGSSPLLEDGPLQLPLVGRDPERAELVTCIEGLFDNLGGVTFVEGEAGIGKTRLIQETRRDAEWRGVQVLGGQCNEAEGRVPFAPLVTALEAGLSHLRISQLAQLVDRVWLQVLSGLIPALREPIGETPLSELPADRARERFNNAFIQLLSAWGQITPLVLIIEDIHWASTDLMEILLSFATRLRRQRVLILATYRGEDARANPALWKQIQNLDRAGWRCRIQLQGLEQTNFSELIRHALRLANPAPLFEEHLHEETGGNPLFLLETLQVWLEEKILTQDENGNWHTPWDETTQNYGELPTPSAIEHVIARRLKNIDPQLEKILRASAVLGQYFDFSILKNISKLDLPQLLPLLGELVRRRFLIETEAQYRFSHARVRQVVYNSIPAPKRRQYHRQIGEILEELVPDQIARLAYHFYQAQIWQKHLHYSKLAAEQAAANFANTEALAHYARAIELTPDQQRATHYELLLAREKVFDLIGDREAQARNLEMLTKLVAELSVEQKAEVALRQARYAEVTGDYVMAATHAEIAVGLAHQAQSVALETESWLLWGIAQRRQSHYDRAHTKIEKALALARTAKEPQLEADSLRSLGIIYAYQSDYQTAQDHCLQALQIYQEIGDLRGQGHTLNILGVQRDYQSDYAGARTYYEQALQLSRTIGDRRGEADALLNIGVTVANLGENPIAKQYYHQALSIYAEIGFQQGAQWALGNLGAVATEYGNYQSAQDYFEQSLAICQDIGDRNGECVALAQICLNLSSLNEDEAALTYGQQALEIAQELNDRYLLSYAHTYLGHAYDGLGRLSKSREAYQQGYKIRCQLEEINLAMEPLAGLARTALASGETAAAQSHVNEILDYLKEGTLDGCDEPVRIYLTCYQILNIQQDPRAFAILKAGYERLEKQASGIMDHEMRASYLESVPSHQELIEAYQQWQSDQRGQQIRVRLPKREAPTGRLLQEDEWIWITWTVAKPQDEVISEKRERREFRLLRLLDEAEAQGGAPTQEDLAKALNVSVATIKRDLAALRKQGHIIQTRGSRSS